MPVIRIDGRTKRIITTALHVAAVGFGLGLVAETAFGASHGDTRATGETAQASEPTTVKAPERFESYIRQGLPAEYRGKTNPHKEPTVPLVIKGADLYNARCASCHGLMGFGNGQAGGALRPRPADLAWSLSSPRVKDDYLYWTIAEGGARFGSNMPAYKDDLRSSQIWEIITYMRAAFEGREARAPAHQRTADARD